MLEFKKKTEVARKDKKITKLDVVVHTFVPALRSSTPVWSIKLVTDYPRLHRLKKQNTTRIILWGKS